MIEISRVLSKFLLVCFVFVLTTLIGCTSVQSPPAPQPNPRTFLKLSLEFLDEYRIPKDEFQGTPVGGLSAIDYDPVGDRYYVLSDDRSQLAPARFYTMKLSLDERGAKPQIRDIQLETMTSLINAERENFLQGSIDPEGLALSPRNSLFIASEGDTQKNILPFVKEFTFDGEEIENLRMPKRFLPISPEQGIQNNLGFEALALSAPSIAPEDPFRIFFAPESSLRQDKSDISEPAPIRLLHYVVNPIGDPVLIAEHLYPLEPTPDGVISNGLVELIALPRKAIC